MACPKCGCKETYAYFGDDDYDEWADTFYDRCANCGHVFDNELEAVDDDDE